MTGKDDKNLGGYDEARNLAYQYISDKSPEFGFYGIVTLIGHGGSKGCNGYY